MTKEEFYGKVAKIEEKYNAICRCDLFSENMVIGPSIRIGDYFNGVYGIESFEDTLEILENMAIMKEAIDKRISDYISLT